MFGFVLAYYDLSIFGLFLLDRKSTRLNSSHSAKSRMPSSDMYRIVSPYEKDHAVVLYTDQAKDKAVVYAFDMHPRYAEILQPALMAAVLASCWSA